MKKPSHLILFLLLLSVFVPKTASGKTNGLNRIFYKMGFISDPSIEVCSEEPKKTMTFANESQAWKRAEAEQSTYCRKVDLYRMLIRQYPQSERLHEAYQMMYENLLSAQDFVLAINLANDYLNTHAKTEIVETSRLYLIRALERQIKTLPEGFPSRQKWVALAMGADITQTEDSPYLKNLSVNQFLVLHPQSRHQLEVEAILEEVRQEFSEGILDEARELRMRRDFNGLFKKLDLLLRWGPVLNNFDEALFEATSSRIELAYSLLHDYILHEVSINRLMNRNLNLPVSAEERKSLSMATLKSADKFLLMMKAQRPDSEWTAKAFKFRDGLFPGEPMTERF